MSDDLGTAPREGVTNAGLLSQPVRLTLLLLVALGAFDIGRLAAGAIIGPWLAGVLLNQPGPVMVGAYDLARIGVEIVAIGVGVVLAALIAIPLAKLIARRV